MRKYLLSTGNDLQRGCFDPYNEDMWVFSPWRQTKTYMKMFKKYRKEEKKKYRRELSSC